MLLIDRTARFIARLLQILREIVVLSFSASSFVDGRKVHLNGPLRLRLFLERVGGAFIKLGQVLALRQDFVPIRYTEELLKLLSNVPEASWTEIEAVFVSAHGRTPKEYFRDFDTQAIASASIGQVYRAMLEDGTPVAVKIRRPGVMELFETDFLLASFLGEIFGILTFTKSLPIHDVVAEFITTSRIELDFRNEAENGSILRKHAEGHQGIVLPKIFEEHTTECVLVSEFLDRIVTAEAALRGIENKKDFKVLLKRESGIDIDKVVSRFIIDGLRQYLIDGFFHADPHPGNIFMLSEDRIGYFDFGMVGRAGEKRIHVLHIIHAIANKDHLTISSRFLEFAKSIFEEEIAVYRRSGKKLDEEVEEAIQKIQEIMIDNFALEVETILAPWYAAVEKMTPLNTNTTILQRAKSSSNVFMRIIAMAQGYGVTMPREVVMFFRSISIADLVALRLNPRFDIIQAIHTFFHEYPLLEAERIINERTHEKEIESIGTLDTVVPSMEIAAEIKAIEQERIHVARERLVELIAGYSEIYPEVRDVFKPKRPVHVT